MKGIMFIEDMFKMVLNKLKSETRRIATTGNHFEFINFNGKEALFYNYHTNKQEWLKPKYKGGEIVYLKEPYLPNYFDDKSTAYKFIDWTAESSDLLPEPKWKNKMFMPEKYSRFKIEIVSVNIEKLNNITEKSAINEGIAELLQSSMQLAMNGRLFRDYSIKKERFTDGVKPIKSYETLWNSINKDIPFKSNPYVWVYSFHVFN